MFFCCKANGQGGLKTYTDSIKYYTSLAQDQRQLAQKEFKTFVQSNSATTNEKDLQFLWRLFLELRQHKTADSLQQLAIARFPHGSFARDKRYNDLVNAHLSGAELKKAYEKWITEFPEATGDNSPVYNYLRIETGHAFLVEGNLQEALKWNAKLTKEETRFSNLFGIGRYYLEKQNYVAAKKILTETTELIISKKDQATQLEKAVARYAYDGLSVIAFNDKDYKQAAEYAAKAFEGTGKQVEQFREHYALAIAKVGRYDESLGIMASLVSQGQGGENMENELHNVYMKLKGGEVGYSAFKDSLMVVFRTKITEELKKQIINQSAPDFSLVDLKGKTVQLSSLKGKTVILDFWATWCVPCKHSFPSMKMTMERLKNDTTVQFLYIHTSERVPHPEKEISAYITENNYPFEVLLDLKDPETKEHAAGKAFNVVGIPAKFVIDRQGHIRFRMEGSEVGDRAAVEKLLAMIELSKS